MSETPAAETTSLPSENVPRGTLLALLIIPAGILAWVLLWQFGLVASIVAFGISLGALWLYRFGSGGRISRTGAIRVTIITVVALVLSFVAGLVSDVLPMYANQRNLDYVSALTSGEFWTFFSHALSNNFENIAAPLVIAALFGLLGCFSVLRTAFRRPAPPMRRPSQARQHPARSPRSRHPRPTRTPTSASKSGARRLAAVPGRGGDEQHSGEHGDSGDDRQRGSYH